MFEWLKQKKASSPAAKTGHHAPVAFSRGYVLSAQDRRRRSDDDDDNNGFVMGLATGVPIPLTPSSMMGASLHQNLMDDDDRDRRTPDTTSWSGGSYGSDSSYSSRDSGSSWSSGSDCGSSSDSGGSSGGSCGGGD